MFKQLESNFTDAQFLFFDLGNFSDNPTAEGTLKTQALVEAMNRLGCAAANVGERDLSLGYDVFHQRTQGAAFPFVSTNIVRQDTREPLFDPYVILEVPVSGRNEPLRVGVLGLVRFNPVFLKSGPEGSKLVILPPTEMVKRYIEEVRDRSDLVVLLAALHKDDARLVSREVPGIDVVLGSYGSIYSTREETEGDTFILYSGNQGRRIGETRVFVGDDGGVQRALSYQHVLTARYPADPEMQEFVNGVAARIHERKAGTEGKKVDQRPASDVAGGPAAASP